MALNVSTSILNWIWKFIWSQGREDRIGVMCDLFLFPVKIRAAASWTV